MNMKISKRDAGLLLGLLGILAIAIVYNFVYKTYTEKANVLKIENETLKKRVDVLQGLANKYDELEESTAANKEATRELLERFPSDVRAEDAIMLAVNIQGQAPYETISNIGIGDASEIINAMDIDDRLNAAMEERLGAELAGTEGQTEDVAPEDDGNLPEDTGEDDFLATGTISLDGRYILKKRDFTINGTATYEGFKESVKMLAERRDRTQISVMASYDIESGLVDAQLSLSAYYMTGTGKLYQPPNIPFISQGTNNIFGTISLEHSSGTSVGQYAPEETEETEGAEETEETETE